jgi:hypothetical protein
MPMEPDTFNVIAAGLPLGIQGRATKMKKPVIRYVHSGFLFSIWLRKQAFNTIEKTKPGTFVPGFFLSGWPGSN